jgi:peptidoglycan/xylan/chitin deacetylase (PgdA/CDA1 family)
MVPAARRAFTSTDRGPEKQNMRMEMDLSRRIAAAALVALLAACGGGDEPATQGSTAGDSAGVTVTGDSAAAGGPQAASTPRSNLPAGPTTQLPPNELGRIMVLEYHRTGSPEGEFVRTLENFRKDLKALHDAGYRPVTMRQVLEGNIDIPQGTTPVVFTMDDATRGQFYLRPDGSVDPNTMMGSWMSFKEQNPSWGPGGMVWCILPAAAHPSNFFGETADRETPREQREANIRKKMEIIVRDGHEVCNHTLYHARLDRASGVQQAMDWIGIGEDSIKAYLPADYDIVTFALPLGMWPAQKSAAWEGTYRNGKRYENKVVLEVSGGPSVTPWDTRWDPHSVDRFIVAPGALEAQLRRWEQDPTNRYISDGDPQTISYPASQAQYLNRSALGGRTPREVAAAAPAAAGAAPAAAPAGGAAKAP